MFRALDKHSRHVANLHEALGKLRIDDGLHSGRVLLVRGSHAIVEESFLLWRQTLQE
jgi:hypothetical protein